MKKIIAVAVIGLSLAGCSTYSPSPYAASADNVAALRLLEDTDVAVGPFTASVPGQNEITCRAVGPIRTMQGEPFSEYVRMALIEEMKMAEVYDPDAQTAIAGKLNFINFSTASDPSHWDMTLTLSSSNGGSMVVTDTFNYPQNFIGETACNQTANSFMPAVQRLIGKVVRSPDFVSLTR